MNKSLKIAGNALRSNIKPGLLLWLLMILFGLGYFISPAFRAELDWVGQIKIKTGYWYTLAAYILFAAILPEILKIVTLQKGKITKENWSQVWFSAAVFGFFGIVTDVFYQLQGIWFGNETGIRTALIKMVIDQSLYTPVANVLIMLLFLWKIKSFRANFLKGLTFNYILQERLLPVLVVTWLIWIPGGILVYSMPAELQLPIASLILCFWSLIISFVNGKQETREGKQ